WSDGNSLEIRIDQEPIYTLVNASQRHLYKINTKEKKILNLSDNVKQAPHIPDVEGISIDYVLHGAGPVILGFDTELYLLKVNDDICRSEYLVKSDVELTNILPGLGLMMEYKINTTFRDLPEDLDLCFVANHLAYKRYGKYGFPIKSEDQFGKVQFELISIKKDAENPVGNFHLPDNYISN
ncbi:MAG: hypothetical protein OEM38_08365, partial [Gammaproteobacteria bacterium]|nr:hypothetical protein [Gammaproteobacteria bacterium]